MSGKNKYTKRDEALMFLLGLGIFALFAGALARLSLSRRIITGAPTFTTDTGINVYLQGHDAGIPDWQLGARIDRVYFVGLSQCPRPDQLRLGWGTTGYVIWRDDNFDCGNRRVHGCVTNGAVYVGNLDVLTDELAHVVFAACYGTSGEDDFPDGGAAYSDKFNAFLSAVKE